ncbi:MAG: efflux RND transporter permease subunit [Chitinophagaceae bacterium]|nr:efflux RND transporter permease subunit [Chitinophagaceae bacterium]
MWRKLGKNILAYRLPLLVVVLIASAFMTWQASKVELSYEFSRAIPSDHPANLTYQAFRAKYGQDGNLLVIGIQTDQFFKDSLFNQYTALYKELKQSYGVTDVIAAPSAVNLMKDAATEKLNAAQIFPSGPLSQAELDSLSQVFYSLPFYQGLLYNPETNAWLMGVSVDKTLMNTRKRNDIVKGIREHVDVFEKTSGQTVYLSGLPLIRTEMATRIADEMKWFLLGSVLLSALILLIFFRSFSAMILSLGVVILGVIWTMGTMQLLGYKITLLTALIPPLIVVIGIPNCIYFLNKYHTSFNECGNRHDALVTMVSRMGIVTLFCNLAAAIGFAVFALTKSEILQEFGVVAGINIMVLFFISLIVIPVALSLLPPPKSRHTKYLENARLNRWLDRLERWSLNHRKLIYGLTAVVMVAAIAGIFRLKSVGFIVDDLPKTDKIYTDLKFFRAKFQRRDAVGNSGQNK